MMDPMLFLYIALAGIGLLFLWAFLVSLRRWWIKPYSNPAKLYRKLRRMKKLSRDAQKTVLEKASQAPSDKKSSKPIVDWLQASRYVIDPN
jgi:hypothetical protein